MLSGSLVDFSLLEISFAVKQLVNVVIELIVYLIRYQNLNLILW